MPSSSKPIKANSTSYGSVPRSVFSSSYLSASPIAEASLARDLEDLSEDEGAVAGHGSESDAESETSTVKANGQGCSMAGSYRRPSFVAFGGTRPTVTPALAHHDNMAYLTKEERKESRKEERCLLRDNHLVPPKHPETTNPGRMRKIWSYWFSTERPTRAEDTEAAAVPAFTAEPSESSALLANGVPETNRARDERMNRAWEEAVRAGKIKTTWQREAKTIAKYSRSLVVTFVLQYSLTVASIFTVGHLGKVELGAVSLASMTANITGYAIYQGLATSLDTLCAQAYGSGRKQLVGLQLQRMVWFLWALTIPIGIVWLSAEKILELIVPEQRYVA